MIKLLNFAFVNVVWVDTLFYSLKQWLFKEVFDTKVHSQYPMTERQAFKILLFHGENDFLMPRPVNS